MPYLVAAVVLLGVLGLVNLLFTLGILRRMRTEHDWHPDPLFALGPGSAVGEFSARTIADEPVSHDTVAGMVAFFSAGCEACHDRLPQLLEHARSAGRENVLAVVGGHDEDIVRALAPVARVILADLDGGPVAHAFQNTWTPALYLVGDDHRVIAAASRLEELPREARAGVGG
jgi:hypothetical protein